MGDVPRHPLVRLVTRLVIAQAATAAAVGLAFSWRHLPSVMITVALASVCCLLAALVRAGGRSSWLMAAVCEAAFFLFGLSRFVDARYVGGTLFALVIVVTLLNPRVAAAYAVTAGRSGSRGQEEGG